MGLHGFSLVNSSPAHNLWKKQRNPSSRKWFRDIGWPVCGDSHHINNRIVQRPIECQDSIFFLSLCNHKYQVTCVSYHSVQLYTTLTYISLSKLYVWKQTWACIHVKCLMFRHIIIIYIFYYCCCYFRSQVFLLRIAWMYWQSVLCFQLTARWKYICFEQYICLTTYSMCIFMQTCYQVSVTHHAGL